MRGGFWTPRRFWTLVILGALILRVVLFLDFMAEGLLSRESLGDDSQTFRNWARILTDEGRWLSDFSPNHEGGSPPIVYAPFHQTPLYPYLLALWARLFSLDLGSSQSIPPIVTLQMAFGIALIFPVYRMSRLLGGERLARGCVVAYLLCDVAMYYQTVVLCEFTLMAINTCALWALVEFLDSKKTKWAVVLGLFMGLSVLAKPTFLAVAPPVLLYVAIRTKAIKGTLAAVAMMSALIMIPVARNLVINERALEAGISKAGGRPAVPPLKITTRGSLEYIHGNSYHSADPGSNILDAGGGQGVGWDFEKLMDKHYRTLFYGKESAFAKRVLGSDPEWEADRGSIFSAMKLTWAEHSEKGSWLSRFFTMQLTKLWAYFNGYEYPNNESIYIAKKYTSTLPIFMINGAMVLGLFLFALPSFWMRRSDEKLSASALLALSFAVATVFYYVLGRFRAPLIPIMLVLGIHGAAALVDKARSGGGLARMTIIIWALLCVGVVYPRDVRGSYYQEHFKSNNGIRLADYYNYALCLAGAQQHEKASRVINDALDDKYSLAFLQMLELKIHILAQLENPGYDRSGFCSRMSESLRGKELNRSYAVIYAYALDSLIREADGLAGHVKDHAHELLKCYEKFGLHELQQRIVDLEGLESPRPLLSESELQSKLR